MNINDAIALLKAYNGPFELTLHTGAKEALLDELERAAGYALPDDFKTCYRFTDGFEMDEDIFNMIPLKEIIENVKTDKQFWVAEYMIYSDMWALEVNPEDHNNYTISILDTKAKIVLTNSLGDFIARFLKGYVFEIGGLYHWADEVKAKMYGNTDPYKIKPLLAVFRQCLKLGLMTRQEVIDRADWIISTEHEPHHFFIDLSNSYDLNVMLTTLDSIKLNEDVLQFRVIFSVVHLKLMIKTLTTSKAIAVLDNFVKEQGFTAYEVSAMRYLSVQLDYLDENPDQILSKEFDEQVKSFFNHYSLLNMYHHNQWEKINADIVKKFLVEN